MLEKTFLLQFRKLSIMGIQNIGLPGLILIIAVILLLFGGRKIPELMRGLGKGIKEFKDATQGKDDDDRERDRRRDADRIND